MKSVCADSGHFFMHLHDHQDCNEKKLAEDAIDAIMFLVEATCKEVIGPNVRVFVQGKELHDGDPMMIDLSGGVDSPIFKESCKNIQENGRNLEKVDARNRLAELIKGEERTK